MNKVYIIRPRGGSKRYLRISPSGRKIWVENPEQATLVHQHQVHTIQSQLRNNNPLIYAINRFTPRQTNTFKINFFSKMLHFFNQLRNQK